jgi:hypothetical protein
MIVLLYFALFGGGFVIGLTLLLAACFVRRRVMKRLIITALITVGLQGLFWIWLAGISSVGNHGGYDTSLIALVGGALAAFGIAASWSWLLFKFRRDHAT